jgi:hypothetical protein
MRVSLLLFPLQKLSIVTGYKTSTSSYQEREYTSWLRKINYYSIFLLSHWLERLANIRKVHIWSSFFLNKFMINIIWSWIMALEVYFQDKSRLKLLMCFSSFPFIFFESGMEFGNDRALPGSVHSSSYGPCLIHVCPDFTLSLCVQASTRVMTCFMINVALYHNKLCEKLMMLIFLQIIMTGSN